MNISAPRVEVISSPDSSQEQYAGQPQKFLNKKLARGYYPSVIVGCTIPPLVALVSIVPLEARDAIVVTTWVALMLAYILSTLARMRSDLRIGNRKWNELQANALELERAYDGLSVVNEKLQYRYDYLYAEFLLQRGAVPLVAKRARGTVADSPSGVNGSATVVPFKTDGAA